MGRINTAQRLGYNFISMQPFLENIGVFTVGIIFTIISGFFTVQIDKYLKNKSKFFNENETVQAIFNLAIFFLILLICYWLLYALLGELPVFYKLFGLY